MSKDKDMIEEKENRQEENSEQTNAENKEEQSPEQKIAELNDKYVRLYAEFDNFRKRTLRERIDILKFAGEDIFKEILPVVDDFERSMKATENVDDGKAIKEGVQLIYNKLQSALKQKGVEVMDCRGKDFDAETMEAITSIPAPTPELKGKVVDEIEKGYTLNGKVIRFAKVVVGN